METHEWKKNPLFHVLTVKITDTGVILDVQKPSKIVWEVKIMYLAEIQGTWGNPCGMEQFIQTERGRLDKEATAEEGEWFYGLWYLMVQLEMTGKSLIFKVTDLSCLRPSVITSHSWNPPNLSPETSRARRQQDSRAGRDPNSAGKGWSWQSFCSAVWNPKAPSCFLT